MGASVTYLSILWGLVTAVLVGLLVYRGFLESREDDQIFISKGEEHIAAEQNVIINKVTRLGGPIRALSVASAVLLVVAFGAWLWNGFTSI